MSEIVDLSQARERRGGTGSAECPCGSQWFVLKGDPLESGDRGAVTLTLEGRVTGYYGTPHCIECDRPWLLL